jgi:two-component system alkaline phosphatase synthesis response regulator PhoP
MTAKSSHSILLVDDDNNNVTLLAEILGEKGYKMLTAENGKDAIKKAETIQPDLILLDIAIPGMDGLDILKQLKHFDQTKHIPVILVTGVMPEVPVLNALKLNDVGYIAKPFIVEDLLKHIEQSILTSAKKI